MSVLNDLDVEDLWERSQGLVIPGTIGAASGAGLGAFLTSRKKRGETTSDRRSRLLRNALIGAGAGGVASTALPAGARMLSEASEEGIGDTLSDLLANSAILGTGAAGGYAGGTWASNALMGSAEEAKLRQRTLQDLYQRLSNGRTANVLRPWLPKMWNTKNDPPAKAEAVASAAHANSQDFLDELAKRRYNEQVAKLRPARLSSQKTAILKMEAADWARAQMGKAGLEAPDSTLKSVLDRLKDPVRWKNRWSKLKDAIGLSGSAAAGDIWGSTPTKNKAVRSALRTAVKKGLPGLGLAAGGLFASQFV